ncbi:p047 [Rhizobium phage 16-3]|uniref:NinI-like serine-threonine phosphatase n=1 Tax=Rhizobium phage 16-3 TaxID=10704 RepID=UPI00017BA602|nr:NinI-like serine-threonine phosphatase [Rhizobium phage 16-3]ABF71298.1 p047 [Rhizobium phage 16-3]
MSKTFVIADLHGRHDLLVEAIKRIEESSHSGGTVVFTGDYVDRGPASRQVIETLMAGPSDQSRWTWVCLRGNHEEIMLTCCVVTGLVGRYWLPNGGGATLVSYGQKVGEDVDVSVVPNGHLEWIRSLPVMHIDKHRLFVHAGVQGGVPLEEQDAEKNVWMLYPDGAEDGYKDDGLSWHVVHGHHQHEDGPMLYAGRSNFDTLAWWTGRLVVGVFDDEVPGGPVSTIEVKGPHIEDMRRAAA